MTETKRIKYSGQHNPHLVSINAYHPWDINPNDTTHTVLSRDEINNITAGYEEVEKTFTKRLNTYLKRYGTSKLNVWTYLRD